MRNWGTLGALLAALYLASPGCESTIGPETPHHQAQQAASQNGKTGTPSQTNNGGQAAAQPLVIDAGGDPKGVYRLPKVQRLEDYRRTELGKAEERLGGAENLERGLGHVNARLDAQGEGDNLRLLTRQMPDDAGPGGDLVLHGAKGYTRVRMPGMECGLINDATGEVYAASVNRGPPFINVYREGQGDKPSRVLRLPGYVKAIREAAYLEGPNIEGFLLETDKGGVCFYDPVKNEIYRIDIEEMPGQKPGPRKARGKEEVPPKAEDVPDYLKSGRGCIKGGTEDPAYWSSFSGRGRGDSGYWAAGAFSRYNPKGFDRRTHYGRC